MRCSPNSTAVSRIRSQASRRSSERPEVLGLVRVVGCPPELVSVGEHLQGWQFPALSAHLEILRGLHRLGDSADADVARTGDLHPDSVPWLEVGQCLAEPRPASAADEAVLAGILPRATAPERDVVLAVPRLLRAALRWAEDYSERSRRRRRHTGTPDSGFSAP